ncbi:RHS repeat-associated core domain-containing protein [Vibrio sp. HN007]|uniref:RHS repeat-associated core domain-containing protein n=1 Tax=Vibrio iocasae TaxID=3098914 RepID=UPI0035D4F14B
MSRQVYDEVLGRFLSADPLIQAPYVTNSFNRYSYVVNNPLKSIDPTGFVFVRRF